MQTTSFAISITSETVLYFKALFNLKSLRRTKLMGLLIILGFHYRPLTLRISGDLTTVFHNSLSDFLRKH